MKTLFVHRVNPAGNYITWCRQSRAWEVGTNYDPQIGGGNVVGYMRPILRDNGPMTEGGIELEVFLGPWGIKQRVFETSDWKSGMAELLRRSQSEPKRLPASPPLQGFLGRLDLND